MAAALDALRQRLGLSLANLETKARQLPPRKNGQARWLPRSTTSDLLSKGRPSQETLETFLAVCEVPAQDVSHWIAALHRVQTAMSEGRGVARVPEVPGPSPFPGLAAFDANRATMFRGREAEIRRLTDRMLSLADAGELVAVVGPSGCGKSSLVAAGLVPALAADGDWLVTLPMSPGSQPAAALAATLADAGRRHGLEWETETLTPQLDDPLMVAHVVGELLAAAAPAKRLLLVIDQAEELLVSTSVEGRNRFLALLAAASVARARVVATLRSEYLDPLLDASAKAGLTVHAEALAPLTQDRLPVVIAEPARLAGLHIDDELVTQMVLDTGDGQALPLLAYTLQRLSLAAQDVDTNVLSAGLYEQIGGVRGSLVDHADAALADAIAATSRTRQEVLAALLQLATVDIDERPIRRRLLLDHLSDPIRAQLDPFINRRLLIVDTPPTGPATVEVAHERFLTAWPPLTQAIADDTDRLRQRAQAETAAYDWQQAGRPREQLWTYNRAAAVLGLLAPDDLSLTARLFLVTSRRRARRRLINMFTGLTVLLLVVTSLGVVASLQSQRANDQRRITEQQQRIAVARQLLTLADSAREADTTTALRLAIAANDIAPGASARSNLLETLGTTPRQISSLLTGDTGQVSMVGFGPDGRLLATGSSDGTVRLWDISDPTHPRQISSLLTGDTGQVSMVGFGPDGSLLATGSSDGTVRLWDDRPTRPTHAKSAPCSPATPVR
ncbi:WD-40 repeat protein [Parafrankia sp. EUN1f]|nr:WD-40 repeat protein [Parafrankia sp. EUN1f]